MNNIMIDLETLGTTPDAAFVSIGACWFDPERNIIDPKDTFYTVIGWHSAMQNRAVDASTLQWWLRQDKRAVAAIMDSGDSPTLGDALLNFSRWVKNHRKPRVWSNGATFDIAILENAYRQLGYEEHIPWLYPHIRDVRTVCALAEGVVNKELFLFRGTPHVAVDDAIHQAKYVCAMWQALRG